GASSAGGGPAERSERYPHRLPGVRHHGRAHRPHRGRSGSGRPSQSGALPRSGSTSGGGDGRRQRGAVGMISRSIIVETTVDIVVRSAMVFAFFLLFRGHNAPGGGFVAGLVVGISLVIRMVARGRPGVLSALPTAPE